MSAPTLHACHCCGLIQSIPGEWGTIAPGHQMRCARCHAGMRPGGSKNGGRRSLARAGALALAALILFPVAMSLPVLEIHRLGVRREATIWSGAVQLMADRQVLVGLIVFTCSIVIPLLKIGGVFVVCAGGAVLRPRERFRAYRAIEFLGRWGMVDVLLVAILVAAVKLGNWMEVHPGPGALAFAAMVLLSMASSAVLDPAALWGEER